MAMADYRCCDVCGGKAFYDANLNYEDGGNEFAKNREPFKIAGAQQYDKPDLLKEYGTRLDYVGDWCVICTDCSKTHRIVIEKIEAPAESGSLTYPCGSLGEEVESEGGAA